MWVMFKGFQRCSGKSFNFCWRALQFDSRRFSGLGIQSCCCFWQGHSSWSSFNQARLQFRALAITLRGTKPETGYGCPGAWCMSKCHIYCHSEFLPQVSHTQSTCWPERRLPSLERPSRGRGKSQCLGPASASPCQSHWLKGKLKPKPEPSSLVNKEMGNSPFPAMSLADQFVGLRSFTNTTTTSTHISENSEKSRRRVQPWTKKSRQNSRKRHSTYWMNSSTSPWVPLQAVMFWLALRLWGVLNKCRPAPH